MVPVNKSSSKHKLMSKFLYTNTNMKSHEKFHFVFGYTCVTEKANYASVLVTKICQ